MTESWRNILKRAAANFQIEQNEKTSGDIRYQHGSQRESPWSPEQPYSDGEAHGHLERELEAAATRSLKHRPNHKQTEVRRSALATAIDRPHVAFVVTPPAQNLSTARTDRQRGSSWPTLAAISFAVAIIGLTGYLLLKHGSGTGRQATGSPSGVAEKARARLKPASRARSAPTKPQPDGERAFSSSPRASQALLLNPLLPAEQAPNRGSGPGTASRGDANDTALAPKTMMTSLNRATEDALLDRASTLLKGGDIAIARVIYETLASYGSLRGTIKLAETYEARQPDVGLKPDLRLARQWYERAALLGSVEAYQRLKVLDKGG
jgi:hypothetical protein